MASGYDELEVNPFFTALQNEFLDLYEKAQDMCYWICVPQSESILQGSMGRRFAEIHVLKPSPFFKGQFESINSGGLLKTITVSDNDRHFIVQYVHKKRTIETSIKVLSEELAYNKNYEQFKILILERPLHPKYEHIMINGKNKAKEKENFLHTHKLTEEECREFLTSIPEFDQALPELLKNIEHFSRHYMVLPDYLDDASSRIQLMCIQTLQKIVQPPPLNYDQKFLEVLTGALESYVMSKLYPKIYPVVSQRLRQEDDLLLAKCHHLNKVNVEDIGVPKEFACPLPSAVVELAHLGMLKTPREKLACLKLTVDNITSGVTASVQENRSLQLAGMDTGNEPVITSDDLIPILVTVISQAKCCHLHTDLYYTDHFMWESTDTDRDDYSYCLVSFKAAVQYMTATDFSHLKEVNDCPAKEISIEDLMASQEHRRSPNIRAAIVPGSQSSRLDRQLNRISNILEKTSIEMKDNKKSTGPLQSIFGGHPGRDPAPDVIPVQDRPQSQRNSQGHLGDFLSSLQDDVLGDTFGKQ